MRMAHRMPEFHLAFEQARKARYVRTKEKRDFEIELPVDKIFDEPATNQHIRTKILNKKQSLIFKAEKD